MRVRVHVRVVARLHHAHLGVDAEVAQHRLQRPAHRARVLRLLQHGVHAQPAALPGAVSQQQVRDHQEQAAVVHDPPHVHEPRDALVAPRERVRVQTKQNSLLRRRALAHRRHQRLGGFLRARVVRVLLRVVVEVRVVAPGPAEQNRVRFEPAEPQPLDREREALLVLRRHEHVREPAHVGVRETRLQRFPGVGDAPRQTAVAAQHALLDLSHHAQTAPFLELRRERQERLWVVPSSFVFSVSKHRVVLRILRDE